MFNSSQSPLSNGYCRDTAERLGAPNLDIFCPMLAMEHEEAFPVLKSFLVHVLKENDMVMWYSICLMVVCKVHFIYRLMNCANLTTH